MIESLNNTRLSQKCCNIFTCSSLWSIYHRTEAVQAVVGSIVVVGALTHCVIFHLYEMKATQVNV